MNLYYFTYFCIDSDPLKNKNKIMIDNIDKYNQLNQQGNISLCWSL
jgi:hypothetical protein